MPGKRAHRPPNAFRAGVTHRVAIAHTSDTLEAWDFCRGVASYHPRSGVWGLQSIPMEPDFLPGDLRRLSRTACDGMIMMPGHWRALRPLHERGVKVVGVDGWGDGDRPPYARIRLDDVYIGQLAGEHLLERGFTRVVYLGDGSEWSRDRADGLHKAAAAGGARCHRIIAPTWWGYLLSEEWIAGQLRPIARPFGVMACDDLIAAHVVRAATAAGWQVPAEVGVIGVDDRITECIGVQPPLSSISTERFRIGQKAAHLLDEAFMGSADAARESRFRPQGVTERQSTSTYVYPDPDVAAAIGYIHREACRGVTIDDVVRHVNLSRRTLERRFVQVIGRPPGDEIRRARLDAVKRAIEHTHLPLADIAAECGYASLSSLSHSFRLATGTSPQAYRRRVRAGEHVLV